MKSWMVVAAVVVLLVVAAKGSVVTGGAEAALSHIANLVHAQGTGDEQDGDSPSQEP